MRVRHQPHGVHGIELVGRRIVEKSTQARVPSYNCGVHAQCDKRFVVPCRQTRKKFSSQETDFVCRASLEMHSRIMLVLYKGVSPNQKHKRCVLRKKIGCWTFADSNGVVGPGDPEGAELVAAEHRLAPLREQRVRVLLQRARAVRFSAGK